MPQNDRRQRRARRQQQFEEFMKLMQKPAGEPWTPPPPPEPEPSKVPQYLAAGTRGLSGFLSYMGGPMGAAAGGGGEAIAELIEGSKLSPARIGTEAALGAVPFRWLFGPGKILQSLGRGTGYAGIGEAMRETARGEELDPGAIATSGAIGGAVGGGLARLLRSKAAVPVGQTVIEGSTAPGGRALQGGRLQPVVPPPVIPGEAKGGIGFAPDVAQQMARERRLRLQDVLSERAPLRGRVPYRTVEEGIEQEPRIKRLIAAEARAKAVADKAAEQARTAGEIQTMKDEGRLTAGPPSVRQTISAPIEGGRESATIQFKPPKPEKGAAAAVAAAEATAAVSSPEMMAKLFANFFRSDKEFAQFLAKAAPAERMWLIPEWRKYRAATALQPPIALQPPTAPGPTPPVTSTTAPPPSAAPVTPPAAAVPKPLPISEEFMEAQRGVVPPSEEQLQQSLEALKASVAKARMAGPTAPTAAAGAVAGAEEASPLLKILGLKSKPGEVATDIAGERYRALRELARRGELEKPEASRLAGALLSREAGKAGLPTRQPPLNEKQLNRFLDDIVAGRVPSAGPRPATTKAPFKRIPTPQELEAAKAKMGHAPGPPGLIGPSRGGGTTYLGMGLGGAQDVTRIIRENPTLALRLLLGGGGAIVGGATDPLDNPLLSALAGAGAGVAAPSIISKIAQIRPDAAAAIPTEVAPVIEAAQSPEGFKSVINRMIDLVPHAIRGNLLAGPNIINNAFVAPYGAALLKGLELTMVGDARGPAILKQLSPGNFMTVYLKNWSKAKSLIGRAERAEGELLGEAPTIERMVASTPGTVMTAGDVASREIMIAAGLAEEEARAATLTSEPLTKLGHAIANFQRSGVIGVTLLPFARTLVNVMEQGMKYTPGLGTLFQGGHLQRLLPTRVPLPPAPPFKAQAAQQLLGAGAGGVGFASGYYAPDDPALQRFFRSASTNVAGPAALLSGIGYVAGRGARAGETVPRILQQAGTEGLRETPLPSTDILTDWWRTVTTPLAEQQWPRDLPPGIVPVAVRQAWQEGRQYRPSRPRRPRRRRQQ